MGCGCLRIQPQLSPWSPLGVSIVWVANSVATSEGEGEGRIEMDQFEGDLEVLNFETYTKITHGCMILHVFLISELVFTTKGADPLERSTMRSTRRMDKKWR